MLLGVSCDCVLWCCSLTPAGCCFTHVGFGIGQVWQYKQRREKKGKKYFAVISAQAWGKGVEEVRRLQIAQNYTFWYPLYFSTAVQLTVFPSDTGLTCGMDKLSYQLGAPACYWSCSRSFISRPTCKGARMVSFACWKRHCFVCKTPSLWSTVERILLMTVTSRLLLQSLSKTQCHENSTAQLLSPKVCSHPQPEQPASQNSVFLHVFILRVQLNWWYQPNRLCTHCTGS